MASTPNFFLFSGLLFLAWFTADVHSVKVLPDVLKGSSVVLPPVEAETSITTISWKHGDNLAAEWNGEELTFYNIFEDTCSLNTTTGELTINNVRPEHSGVYTPDINLRTRSAMKLRVFSPVPKPSISHDCYPGETPTCTLRCMHICTLDNVGHVEVYWIHDDRRVNGSELPITKDSKEETFICSVKNSVSSENSTKLLNPLLPGVPVWKPVVLTAVSLASVALLAFVCWKWIYPKYRRYRIIKEIQETMPEEEHKRILAELRAPGSVPEHERISAELRAPGSVPEEEQTLLHVDRMILRILREGNERNLSEDSILMLLTARYMILRILKQGPAVKKSRDQVEEMIEKYFKGRHELNLSEDEETTLYDVRHMILKIISKKEKLNLSEVDLRILTILAVKAKPKLLTDLCAIPWYVHIVIEGILKKEKQNLSEDVYRELQDVHQVIERILKQERQNMSAGEQKILLHVHQVIERILKQERQNLSEDGLKELQDVHQVIESFSKKEELQRSADGLKELLHVHLRIERILKQERQNLSADVYRELQHVHQVILDVFDKMEYQTKDEDEELRQLLARSHITFTRRDPDEEPLMSSPSGPEAEVPV